MLYTPLTKKALKLCFDAHRDQLDKSGLPYVFHPFHLAEQMDSENAVILALLHDVVEDSDYSHDDLRHMGFPELVLDALRLLTHDPDVPYMAYVAQIASNPLARQVKLADLRHTSDPTRLDIMDEWTIARQNKYLQAIELLENAPVTDTECAQSKR